MQTSKYDPLANGSRHMFGSTFIDTMNDANKYAVLTIGKDRYTKHRLVRELGTGNFLAARKLQKAVKKLGLSSVDDLYNIPPNALAAMEDFGVTTLYVLVCYFLAKGKNIHKWYADNDPSFIRFKQIQRAEKDDKSEHETARAKKSAHLRKTATTILKGKTRGARAHRTALAG